MYSKLLKWSGIIGISVLSLMFAGMLYFSAHKTLIYVQAEEQGQAQTKRQEPAELFQIIPEEKDNLKKFYIPVADRITQEEIYIENDYVNHRITITIDGMDTSFYSDTVMYGRLQEISDVQIGEKEDRLMIVLSMNHMYEYEAVLENQKLCLSFKRPSELYDRIVVLDAGHGGQNSGINRNGVNEAEFALDIAERVKKKLEAEGVHVYMTRASQEAPETEKRIQLANDSEADIFLSIHLAEGTDYGINAYYNDIYFIPELTNAMLANYLVEGAAGAVNNRGNGIFALSGEHGEEDRKQCTGTEMEILWDAVVPAARLELGYPGNVKEAELLKREDYRDQLAEGICQALIRGLETEEEAFRH